MCRSGLLRIGLRFTAKERRHRARPARTAARLSRRLLPFLLHAAARFGDLRLVLRIDGGLRLGAARAGVALGMLPRGRAVLPTRGGRTRAPGARGPRLARRPRIARPTVVPTPLPVAAAIGTIDRFGGAL